MALAADEIHEILDEEALALVNEHFGDPETWDSTLMEYRMSAAFQEDWKAEVGHWLHTAKKHGFLEEFLSRSLPTVKQNGMANQKERDPNDPLHTLLHREISPVMVVHYLVGTGWSGGHTRGTPRQSKWKECGESTIEQLDHYFHD